MAKVSYVNITGSQEEFYYRGLQPGDRFVYSRMRIKSPPISRTKIKGLTDRSLLPQVAEAWNALTISEKEAWRLAGVECKLSAYRLFVKDKCARIKNEISGNATPSILHQVWAGKIHIESPATEVKLIQNHPRSYYIYKKTAGTISQYNPIKVTEDLALPFVLSCNYKSNLTVCGADPRAWVYARFWYSYQGVNLHYDLILPLDISTNWKTDNVWVADLQTILIAYDLYIEINDLQGDIYFDRIKAEHSGQNWARDPNMQDFNQTFTRAFYQIPKHWAPVILPDGANYDSVYQ